MSRYIFSSFIHVISGHAAIAAWLTFQADMLLDWCLPVSMLHISYLHIWHIRVNKSHVYMAPEKLASAFFLTPLLTFWPRHDKHFPRQETTYRHRPSQHDRLGHFMRCRYGQAWIEAIFSHWNLAKFTYQSISLIVLSDITAAFCR